MYTPADPNPQLIVMSRDAARAAQWRAEIAAAGRHQVAAVGQSAVEAVTLVTQIDPDAVICDLQLLDGRAIDLVRRLRQGNGSTAMILIVAPSADNPDLLACLRQGADSYYVDQGPGPTLDSRVHEMLQGEAKMSADIARQVLDHFRRDGPIHQGAGPLDQMLNPLLLSDLERAVLIRLSQGQSVPAVANAERVSVHQIAKCVRTLYRKMAWDLRAGSLSLQLL